MKKIAFSLLMLALMLGSIGCKAPEATEETVTPPAAEETVTPTPETIPTEAPAALEEAVEETAPTTETTEVQE